MRARTVQVLMAVAVAAGLTTAAAAPPRDAPPPRDVPGPVVPGPEVPRPTPPTLAWKVELKDGWRSPTWKQERDGVEAVVELDCGGVISFRLPQYWVQLVPEDGRVRPAVMPDPLPCGVPHALKWDEPAGAFHLLLTKVQDDGVVLRGTAAVKVQPRFGTY